MPGQNDIWRQNWYGVKPYIKSLLGTRLINSTVLAGLRFFPSVRARIHRFPVGLPEVVCHTRESSDFIMLHPLSCDVAREIYWGDGWRGTAQDRLAAQIFESLAKEASLVLDVGAYTGYFSLLA